ncbi:hypothetical protein EV663_12213 [Rhodovulum bhavnagarense]|uniref:Uncharacterized protein n=1 Tax=Rhodovulum bhavnagarense TaxID=992286 RepID=A0A4R2R9B2_9RHOB|nr:hypothetical protein [Rhodovulum bhavnagarense]TCP58537.1 hypothetical protein EV663_12213 [Rhodovulum bhavnagarense]
MSDFNIPLSTDDHVVIGNRLRECRDALMHVMTSAVPGTRTYQEADRSLAALDRLRAELEHDLRGTTRAMGFDSFWRTARRVSGSRPQISFSMA